MIGKILWIGSLLALRWDLSGLLLLLLINRSYTQQGVATLTTPSMNEWICSHPHTSCHPHPNGLFSTFPKHISWNNILCLWPVASPDLVRELGHETKTNILRPTCKKMRNSCNEQWQSYRLIYACEMWKNEFVRFRPAKLNIWKSGGHVSQRPIAGGANFSDCTVLQKLQLERVSK